MEPAKTRVPAALGWFHPDPEAPYLIGSVCRGCGSYFFPLETAFCRNPGCASSELEQIPLSRRGTLWSFTDNHYAPPAPYVAGDPFEPYAIAAVELEREKMVVLGQVVPGVGVGSLAAGMEMELATGTLYEDDEREYLVWKWRPAHGR